MNVSDKSKKNRRIFVDGVNFTFSKRLCEWYFSDALSSFVANHEDNIYDVYLNPKDWLTDDFVKFFTDEWVGCRITIRPK